MEKISKQDVEEWLSSPVTKWAASRLQKERDTLSRVLDSGNTLANDPGYTAQLTARLIGEIAGLDHAISYDYLKDDEETND